MASRRKLHEKARLTLRINDDNSVSEASLIAKFAAQVVLDQDYERDRKAKQHSAAKLAHFRFSVIRALANWW
jgi:hypothetical protein